jgi:hypothetical protein
MIGFCYHGNSVPLVLFIFFSFMYKIHDCLWPKSPADLSPGTLVTRPRSDPARTLEHPRTSQNLENLKVDTVHAPTSLLIRNRDSFIAALLG